MESDALSSFRDLPPDCHLSAAAGKASAIDRRFQYSPMQRWHAKLKVVVSDSALQLKCCNIAPAYSATGLNQQTQVENSESEDMEIKIDVTCARPCDRGENWRLKSPIPIDVCPSPTSACPPAHCNNQMIGTERKRERVRAFAAGR